jgi:hypothetical protein
VTAPHLHSGPGWPGRIATLTAALVGGLLLAALLRKLGQQVNPAYVAGTALVIAALGLLTASVRSAVEPVPEVSVEEVPVPAPYRELISLEERMSWGAVDRHRFDDRVRPQLVRVANERLRQRHGVRLADQPARAREIMGEELWTFLTAAPDPAGKPVSRRELDSVVTKMEAL